jgi:hypothetical protein
MKGALQKAQPMKTAHFAMERNHAVKGAHHPRIIYNDDTCSLRYVPEPHTVDKVGTAADYFKGTQVGALCWSLGAEIAYAYPSQKVENSYEILRQRDELFPVTGGTKKTKGPKAAAGEAAERNLMASLYYRGIDYLPILIERAHENGVQFIADFRMNDVHHKSDPRGPLAPKFWQEHQEYRLWEISSALSYYNGCLDYSFPAVRKRKLDMIREVAEWYDVDGIELDMTRTEYFFQPSEAWKKRGILTNMVKRIRSMLNSIGRKRGRKITLIIRMPFSEEVLKRGGIDVWEWVGNRRFDILAMTSRVNDYNRNVEPYLSMCRKKGILFYACSENVPAINAADYPSMARTRHNWVVPQTDEEHVRRQRAMARHFLEQGVDGIYMFNYACTLFERTAIAFENRRRFNRLASVLSHIGDAKTLEGLDREYCFFKGVPIYVETNRPRKYHQTVEFTILGEDTKKAKNVIVSFRQIAVRNPHAVGSFTQKPIVPRGYMDYYLNDKKVPERSIRFKRRPAEMIPSGFTLDRHLLVEIDVEPAKIKNGRNTLAFEVPRFPEARDPYVYIYELKVKVLF